MKFEVWTAEDCSGKPFRVWRCGRCGRYDIAAYQWYPTGRCECSPELALSIESVEEVNGQLVVWDETYENKQELYSR